MPNNRGQVYDYGYFDDGGTEYVARLTTAVAHAGGFEPATEDAIEMPQKTKMRHVGLSNAARTKHAQLPLAILANPLFNEGGTVSFDNITWDVVGKTGELLPF